MIEISQIFFDSVSLRSDSLASLLDYNKGILYTLNTGKRANQKNLFVVVILIIVIILFLLWMVKRC